VSFESTAAIIASGLIGSVFIGRTLYLHAKVQASRDWPHVIGKITSANLTEDSRGEGTSYEAKVQYEYAVNGVHFTGDRIGFTPQSYVRSNRARQVLDMYRVNAAVTVYFDPAKPGQAVLEREAPNMILGLTAGIILLAIAVAGYLNL